MRSRRLPQEREAEDRKAAQLARQEAQRRARENREAQNRRRPQPRRAEGEEAAGEVKVAEVVVANGDAAAAPAAADAAAAPAPRKAAPPSMADIIRGRAAKAPAPAEPSKESDQGTSVEQDITSLLGSADHHAYRHEEIEAEAAAGEDGRVAAAAGWLGALPAVTLDPGGTTPNAPPQCRSRRRPGPRTPLRRPRPPRFRPAAC